jgi:hypothetical protein
MGEGARKRNYCDYLWAVHAAKLVDVRVEPDACFPELHQDWIGLNVYLFHLNTFDQFFRFDHSEYHLKLTGRDPWVGWADFIRSGMCVYSLKGRPGVSTDQVVQSLIRWETLLRQVGFVTPDMVVVNWITAIQT